MGRRAGLPLALLILSFLPSSSMTAAGTSAIVAETARPADVEIDGEPAIIFSPTPPPSEEVRRRLIEWREELERHLEGVRLSLDQLAESLNRSYLFYLEERCSRFLDELRRVEAEEILPAPDPVLDLHLRNHLAQLWAAARICSRRHYFATEARLQEAADSLQRMQSLLSGRLGETASGKPPDSQGTARGATVTSTDAGDLLQRSEE